MLMTLENHKILPSYYAMALCLMLLPSYYAQNYAGIIGSSHISTGHDVIDDCNTNIGLTNLLSKLPCLIMVNKLHL